MRSSDLANWFRGAALEAVLIVLGAILVTRLVRVVTEQLALHRQLLPELPERLRYRRSVVQAATRAFVGVVWFAAALLVLDRMRLPVATLVAPATVVGAALGFGAQRLVADFLSGFFLIAERQLGYGDVVEIASPASTTWVRGTVDEVTLRYTRLRTPQGGVVTLSNADVRQVVNRSRDLTRVDVTIPVAASADVDQVTHDLHESLRSLALDDGWRDKVFGEPSIAGVESLDLTKIDLRVFARVAPTAVDDVAREIRRRAVAITNGVSDA